MKFVILALLAAIVGALAAAGVSMLGRRDAAARDRRMARALAWRIGLSIVLFLAVLAAWQLGWITPNALPLG